MILAHSRTRLTFFRCVMNAYNNITWESDRLEFEEGQSPYRVTLLAILGIPSEPEKNQDENLK